MSARFNPYVRWLGIPEGEHPPDHYRLLGVARFESRPAKLQQAYQQRVVIVRRYIVGQYEHESQSLLDELSKAYACLAGGASRHEYDKALRNQLGLPPSAAPPWDSVARGAASQTSGDRETVAENNLHPRSRKPANLKRAKPLPLPVLKSPSDGVNREAPAPPERPSTPDTLQAAPQRNPTKILQFTAASLLGLMFFAGGWWFLRSHPPDRSGVTASGGTAAGGGASQGPSPPSELLTGDSESNHQIRTDAGVRRSTEVPDTPSPATATNEHPYPSTDLSLGTTVQWQGVLEKIRREGADPADHATLLVTGRSPDGEAAPFMVYCRDDDAFGELLRFVPSCERLGRGDEVEVTGRVVAGTGQKSKTQDRLPCLDLLWIVDRDDPTRFASVEAASSAPGLAPDGAEILARLRTTADTPTLHGRVLDRGRDAAGQWMILGHEQRQYRVNIPLDLQPPFETLRVGDPIHLQAEVLEQYFRWDETADITQLRAVKLFTGPAFVERSGENSIGKQANREAMSRIPQAETERLIEELRQAKSTAPPGTRFTWTALFGSVELDRHNRVQVHFQGATSSGETGIRIAVKCHPTASQSAWLRTIRPQSVVEFTCFVSGLPLAGGAAAPLTLLSMTLTGKPQEKIEFSEPMVQLSKSEHTVASRAQIQSLAWAREGNILVAADATRAIDIYNLRAKRQHIRTLEVPGRPVSVAWEPQDVPGYFIVTNEAGTASVCELASSDVRHTGGPATWHPERPWCAVWEGDWLTVYRSASARQGHFAMPAEGPPNRRRDSPPALIWTASGGSIAASLDQQIRIQEIQGERFGEVEAALTSPAEVRELQSRFDSRSGVEWLAGVHEGRAGIYFWKKQRGSWSGPLTVSFAGLASDMSGIRSLLSGHLMSDKLLADFAWSADGRYVMVTRIGGFRLVDLSQGARTVSEQDGIQYREPCFSADSAYLAMVLVSTQQASDLLIFDLSRNELAAMIRLPTTPTATAWSSDLRRIATAHPEGHIHVWKLPLDWRTEG